MIKRNVKTIVTLAVGLTAGALIAAGSALPGAVAQVYQSAGNPGEALDTKDISLEQAARVVAAAHDKSEELGVAMNIAVVDAGANLKAFARMDDAWRGSIDIAIKKARTSRLFDMPTGDIGELSQPDGPLYQIEVSNDGLITFPGGAPITTADGTVIGAIGVSGSTVEDDHEVAVAGAQAVLGQ